MKHPDLSSTAPEVRELIAHLLGCPLCRARALRQLPSRRVRSAAAHDLAVLDYSTLWPQLETERALAVQTMAGERQEVPPLLGELLLSLPAEQRTQRVAGDARFHSYPLARALVELTLAPPAGEDGVPLGRLALEIAQSLAEGHSGKPLHLSDLAAAATVALGEALRRVGSLGAAETTLLEAARELLAAAPVDSDTRAFYCQTLAALRRDQDRIDESLAMFGRAAELWRDLGNGTAEAWAWLKLGDLALLEALDPAAALAAFDTAAAVPRLSGRLAFYALAGVVRSLAALDRLDEAVHLLALGRERYRFAPDSYEALELMALEGRLERQRGRPGLARRRLTEAFRGLLRHAAYGEAAQAGVELLRALALDRQGRKDLARAAAVLLDLAQGDRLTPGAQEAVRFCLKRTADARLARRLGSLADYLERSRLRPRLSFHPEDRDVDATTVR